MRGATFQKPVILTNHLTHGVSRVCVLFAGFGGNMALISLATPVTLSPDYNIPHCCTSQWSFFAMLPPANTMCNTLCACVHVLARFDGRDCAAKSQMVVKRVHGKSVKEVRMKS
jgi:hypothetical protein